MLKEILKKPIIIILIIATVIVVLVILFSRGTIFPKPAPSPSPAADDLFLPGIEPTPTGDYKSESDIPKREEQITKELYPLAGFLPLYTDDYSVIYSKPNTLQVTLKNGTQAAAAAQIKDWIKTHGADPSTYELVFK